MKTSLSNYRFPLFGLNMLLTAAILLLPLLYAANAGAQSAPRLALVTRSVPIPGADEAYVEHLAGQGWDVTAIDDDEIRDTGRDAISGYDLVVITSTVYWQRFKGSLRGAPEPVIVAKPELFPVLGLSGTDNGDQGLTSSSREVEIVNPINPMAAGLDGQVSVSTKAKPMNYGKVGPDAYVIATASDSADQAVIFAYETGDKLVNGDIASGPRVGFYMSQAHPGFANRDGWALFDAAAAWAAPNAPEGNTASASYEPIAPENGAVLGADVAKESFPSAYDATLAIEKKIGRKFDIVNRNHEFSAGLNSDFFWDRRHIEDGRTIMISWRATDNPGSTNGEKDPLRARKIVEGQFDEQIEAMATAMRDLEAPVLMLFHWEMDQNPGQPQYIGTPEEFIAAWRYVHGIFEELGATNVEWVWAPRARSFAKNIGQTFYPGSDYVDWVGGLAVPIDTFEDAQTIYTAWNQWAANIGKPQLLWVGLRENPNDASWKRRFINEIDTLATTQWTGIKAVLYYSNVSPLGYDYTIDTSTASLNAFRNLACNPHFTSVNAC